MKKTNDNIWNRTRDLSASRAVPQRRAQPRTHWVMVNEVQEAVEAYAEHCRGWTEKNKDSEMPIKTTDTP